MITKFICLLGLLCSTAEAKTERANHAQHIKATHAKQHVAKPRPKPRQRFTSFPDEKAASRPPDLTIDWGLGDASVTFWWLLEEIPRQMDEADRRWELFVTRMKKYPNTFNTEGK